MSFTTNPLCRASCSASCRDPIYACYTNVCKCDLTMKKRICQYGNLTCGVNASHIIRRICFSYAHILRFAQDLIVFKGLISHSSENVITRAIKHSSYSEHLSTRKGVAYKVYYRHRPTDSRLVPQRYPLCTSQLR